MSLLVLLLTRLMIRILPTARDEGGRYDVDEAEK